MSRGTEKPKVSKEREERPTREDAHPSSPVGRFVRQYQFDPAVYSHFEHETEQRGGTPGGIFRKVMQDYLGGVYITVDDLTPETMERLRRFAKQTFGSARNVNGAIAAIINRWADAESEAESKPLK